MGSDFPAFNIFHSSTLRLAAVVPANYILHSLCVGYCLLCVSLAWCLTSVRQVDFNGVCFMVTLHKLVLNNS